MRIDNERPDMIREWDTTTMQIRDNKDRERLAPIPNPVRMEPKTFRDLLRSTIQGKLADGSLHWFNDPERLPHNYMELADDLAIEMGLCIETEKLFHERGFEILVSWE